MDIYIKRGNNKIHIRIDDCNSTPQIDQDTPKPIHNPHLVEDDGRWKVEGFNQGHMVSRFVAPPPKNNDYQPADNT